MTLGDLLAKTRLLLAAPSAVRCSNQYLIGLINDAQNAVAYEVDFPEAAEQIELIAGQTEYQLTDMVKLLRVYIAQYPNNDPAAPPVFQQVLAPVDIDLLEGDSLEQWDQGQQTPPQGIPANTPAWLAQQQQPTTYPISTWLMRSPIPTAVPWQINRLGAQPPRYYLRGGFAGVVPTPNSAQNWLVIDHVPVPLVMNISSDKTSFQTRFKDAIVYKTCAYACLADRSSDSVMYEQKFEMECAKLREWRATLQANQPKTVGTLPITKRTWFRRSRRGNGWC